MEDKLVNIPFEDLPALRDLYKVDWPKNNVGYGTIDTCVRWLSKDPDIPYFYVFSINGDWRDGTFVVIDWDAVYVNTLNTDYSRLTKAISLVDWSKGYLLAAMEVKFYEVVHKFIEETKLPLMNVSPTKWYRLPASEACKFTVAPPEGIFLKPLTVNDIELPNSLWPFRHEGTLTYLKRLAKRNISVGAFTLDGELVAWCFRFAVGGLATLQVVDSHKRRGLGELMVRAMCKAIGESGSDVFSPVVVTNTPSLKLFEKLGFKETSSLYWFPTTIKDYTLTDNETNY